MSALPKNPAGQSRLRSGSGPTTTGSAKAKLQKLSESLPGFGGNSEPTSEATKKRTSLERSFSTVHVERLYADTADLADVQKNLVGKSLKEAEAVFSNPETAEKLKDTEVAVAYAHGNQSIVLGTAGHVGIDDAQLPEGAVITHNHPSKQALSVGDVVQALKFGASEMRAVAGKSGTFVARFDHSKIPLELTESKSEASADGNAGSQKLGRREAVEKYLQAEKEESLLTEHFEAATPPVTLQQIKIALANPFLESLVDFKLFGTIPGVSIEHTPGSDGRSIDDYINAYFGVTG